MSDFEVGSMPPSGYIAKSEWAQVQLNAGLEQTQCNNCKRWFFPQEIKVHCCYVCPRCEGTRKYKRLGSKEKICSVCDGNGWIVQTTNTPE